MITLSSTTPILRSFDEVRAREFYVGFLGFEVVFEHRFHDGAPLYMGVRRGDCALHLSEHHGDATPGASMRIQVSDVDALCAELLARQNAGPRRDPGRRRRAPRACRRSAPTDPADHWRH